MPGKKWQQRVGRGCRVTLRCFRLPLLLFFVALAAGVVYLNRVGVPQFIQEQITIELRQHGIDLQLGRLHLRGYRKFIAENITLIPERSMYAPQLSIRRAELRLNREKLKHFEFEVEDCTILGGKLDWLPRHVKGDESPFSIENINTKVQFPGRDQWELASLTGDIFGFGFEAHGSLTNASALRRLKSGKPSREPDHLAQERWAKFLKNLRGIQMDPSSRFRIEFYIDGQKPEAFEAKLDLVSPRGNLLGGEYTGMETTLHLQPSSSETELSKLSVRAQLATGSVGGVQFSGGSLKGTARGSLIRQHFDEAEWEAKVETLRTSGAAVEKLTLTATSLASTNNESGLSTRLMLASGKASGFQTSIQAPQFTAEFQHPVDFRSAQGNWHFVAGATESPFGRTERLTVDGRFTRFSEDERENVADESLGFWKYLERIDLDWKAAFGQIQSSKLQVDAIQLQGSWHVPEVVIDQADAGLYGGEFKASAKLDVMTRELLGKAQFNFDPLKIAPLLTPSAQHWLGQFSWQVPPSVQGEARLIMPLWTNRQPDWRKEVLPTLEMSGSFQATNGAFRRIPASAAQSHFTLTNLVWHLPDLLVRRPEGDVQLDYLWHMGSQDYYWRIDSRADLRAIGPVLEPSQRHALTYFDLTTPPRVQGEIWGRWHQQDRIGFRASVTATNFSFRGEHLDFLDTKLSFTNLLLNFSDTKLRRDQQEIFVPSGSFDPIQEVCYVTNATSTMDPDLVTRVIGPKVRSAIKPYHFVKPPSVQVNGRIPTRDTEKADVHFSIVGEDFEYWKFKASNIAGDVFWRGDTLQVTNIQAVFYKGWLRWAGDFDFTVPHGADFQFRGTIGDVDLTALMADLTNKTNKMEGALSGNLAVTAANSEDWKSWQGFGDAKLRDGFLWNVPIFGAFSTLLDKIIPGLGNSRVHSGSASFVIDQSVIRTSDMELRSPALRLLYDGSVDFEGRVDARVQAEILRDAWGIGKILSLALWPISKVFEYKATGTLYHPKSEPLYIPKILMLPFKPLQAVKHLLPGEENQIPPPGSPKDEKGQKPE